MIDKQKLIIDAANDVVGDIAAFLATYHTEELFDKYSNRVYERDYAGLTKLVSEDNKNFEQLLRLQLASDFSVLAVNDIQKYAKFNAMFSALLKESI